MNHATYNITSDKIKLYLDDRLSTAEYTRSKSYNFVWYPGQKCFCAKWSIGAEDFALELVPEIAEDDTPDDVAARVERFEKYAEDAERSAEYAEKRLIDATTDRKAMQAEATAKKQADEAIHWQRRIAGAIANAEHRDRPDVIARRIKEIEADARRVAKTIKESAALLALWEKSPIDHDRAVRIANYDHVSQKFLKSEYPNSKYEGDKSLWSALDDDTITAEQAQAIAIPYHTERIAQDSRTVEHFEKRLEYERAYLVAVGGEALLEPTPRKKSVAPDDGLKKGDKVTCRIWFGNTGQTIKGVILSMGARSVKVSLPAELDPKGYYAKGYQVARDRVKKVTTEA